tara:strand:+ start:212 stop:967 length:756 start_codon:yes stop_codon:yes gene_type:complete
MGRLIPQFPKKNDYQGLLNFSSLTEILKNSIRAQEILNKNNKNRFLKTHSLLYNIGDDYFTDSKNTLGAIYIVRDPRNVFISANYHFSHKNFEETEQTFFDEYRTMGDIFSSEGEGGGGENAALKVMIGTWQTHYNSWNRMNKNFLLIKYEDLLNNPKIEFLKIGNYLNNLFKTNFTTEQIIESMNYTKFENLKKKEKINMFSENPIEKQLKNKEFFRSGPNTKWEKILPKKIVDRIEKAFKKEMVELGYL